MQLFYIREEMKKNGGDLQGAIDVAVKRCMDEGLIADFLKKHSREVTGMLFKEITVEEFAEIRAREAAKDAYDAGVAEGQKSGLELGFSKGEKTGAAQEKREIAKNLKSLKLSTEQIKAATGLSAEEIEAL